MVSRCFYFARFVGYKSRLTFQELEINESLFRCDLRKAQRNAVLGFLLAFFREAEHVRLCLKAKSVSKSIYLRD